MTQENKELLLKDLCARLSYGVVVGTIDNDGSLPNFWTLDSYNHLTEDVIITHCELNADELTYFGDIRPYLFPLSSMTKEQKKELENLGWNFDNFEINNVKECLGTYKEFVTHSDCFILIDWCYKNHFDINNLIPKKLAIDSTNLNIY